VCVQVVKDQAHPDGVDIALIEHALDPPGPVFSRSMHNISDKNNSGNPPTKAQFRPSDGMHEFLRWWYSIGEKLMEQAPFTTREEPVTDWTAVYSLPTRRKNSSSSPKTILLAKISR
jgi:hypothetical protein